MAYLSHSTSAIWLIFSSCVEYQAFLHGYVSSLCWEGLKKLSNPSCSTRFHLLIFKLFCLVTKPRWCFPWWTHMHLLCRSLRDNSITGKIPEELGNLASLTTLDLENNYLTDEIPSSLGNLKNLKYLWVVPSLLFCLEIMLHLILLKFVSPLI